MRSLDVAGFLARHAFCKECNEPMKNYHLLALLGAPLLLSQCREAKQKINEAKVKVATAGDVSFARKTFESLARGDSKVADQIDWPVFTSIGNNLGASYVAISSEVEKQKFVTGFITQFSVSFRESGSSVESFTHWRVTFHDALKTEVAADSPNGLLTIVVSVRDGRERVSSINIVK